MGRRPRLLDLFCGAGGASMGYYQAGFDVVGVDILPQKNYPFTFVQADALGFSLTGFDAIHASPPCQGYSRMRHLPWLKGKTYPLLIPELWQRLSVCGVPWVIENVEDAPMPSSVVLCGYTLGLPLYRHRRFGSTFAFRSPHHLRHTKIIRPGRMLGNRGRILTWERATHLPNAMGCWWMTLHEVSQAIPPVYTQWIGRQLITYL